jgi:Mg2+ and Co2+ transporter CorA
MQSTIVPSEPATTVAAEHKKPIRGRGKKAVANAPHVKVLRVPPAKKNVKSTLWARHVYQVYQELIPVHLTSEEFIDAFNSFVDRLASYDEFLETYIPTKSMRYRQGLMYETLTFQRYLDGSIPGFFKNENEVWRHPDLKETHKRIVDDIKTVYKVLYDIVKDDLVPALKKKEHEEKVKKWVPRIRRTIEDVERAMEGEKARHERAIVREQEEHEMRMQDYQRILQDNIQELATLRGSTTNE